MSKENGNGNGRNAVRLMVPVTAIGVFIAFGIGAGRYVASLEAKMLELERSNDGKMDRREFAGWVRELQRDPTRPPEPR